MATFQQRRDPLRLMWRRVVSILLILLIAVALRGVWGVYQKSNESYALKVEAEAERDELKKRESELRADISNLRSEKGIEAELRERYDLAAPGESVVVIVEPPPPPPEPKQSPLQRFKSIFSR